jgi:hypothetical protein
MVRAIQTEAKRRSARKNKEEAGCRSLAAGEGTVAAPLRGDDRREAGNAMRREEREMMRRTM